ncbi:hypothetical protein IQ241_09415 [Romeria aff. gracilis LEGE 07310]|uniref:Uncharacterized protein n=1 Tax=Vasconcelosia minhoensis LEGE 07310 TaxID=915328 RepID=A0A8J7AN16_9CYAN|nr:hypothetical protein [Romeria gracilis]MBE9077514.1 hypothetical protein [Romeria aff. gracilis LEGE 07310]
MSLDILILTIYFLIVLYVLYQMALSLERLLEDQVSINLDHEQLAARLRNQLAVQTRASYINAEVKPLPVMPDSPKQKAPRISSLSLTFEPPTEESRVKRQDAIAAPAESGAAPTESDSYFAERITLRVLPMGKRSLEPPIPFLTVEVVNTTPDIQLYIDWDRSSIAVLSFQAERVIRLLPGMDFDLFHPQVMSVLNPQQSLKANVANEPSFVRNAESQRVEPGKPLVDIQKTVGLLQVTSQPNSQRQPLSLYTLKLLIGVKRLTEPDSQMVTMLAPFHFTLELLPEQVALPPLRWLLNLPRQRQQRLQAVTRR